MNFLVIDTSAQYLYAAVYIKGRLCEVFEKDLKNKHSETLLLKLDSLLSANGVALSDMDYFCAAAGPGSFTGIRIGVTTVRAFAQVYNKPVVSVNSLELKAYNIGIKGIALPLIDAVKGSCYCGAYLNGKEIVPPFVCPKDEIEKHNNFLESKYGESVNIIYGDGGIRGAISPENPPDYAGYCIKKIEKGGYTDYNGLVPVYAALSQAEKEYENKHCAVD